MAERDLNVTPFIIDRLVDYDPRNQSEAPKSALQNLRELKQSVRRDLEWILNSRRMVVDIDPGLEETNRSVAVYGLTDFIGAPMSNVAEQKTLVRQVETAIKLFAPQLINVKVNYEAPNGLERIISFRIEGQLNIDPAPEPVVFDTVLQIGSGEFGVKEV
jgi:type VI secretion system lysozyme-related protein